MKVSYEPDRGNRKPDGKGVHREVESEGSRRQSAGSTNRNRMGGSQAGCIFKSDTCTESLAVDAAGIKREGESALPGEVCNFAKGLRSSRGGGMKLQKSAEGIVGSFDRAEGPNMK